MINSNTAPIRIRLIKMSDPDPLPPGSLGVVTGRDDVGDYHVDWDCGSQLKLIPGVDEWEPITSPPIKRKELVERR